MRNPFQEPLCLHPVQALKIQTHFEDRPGQPDNGDVIVWCQNCGRKDMTISPPREKPVMTSWDL